MLAVLGALIANGVITVMKLVGALMTGSSGMMAETLHSLADTTNQIFLLLGLRFFKRPPSDKHPFGYGKERFFWSFIAAIFIFGVGATFALYEGYQKLVHPHPPENLQWAYWILGISFVLEAGSIALALYQEVGEAHHEGLTFMQYLRESKDPTAKTVIFEDSAALIGIVIAFAGIYLTDHHIIPGFEAYWDGLASMIIGGVLAVVAFALAKISRGLLLGESAIPNSVAAMREAVLSHPNVKGVVDLLTMHMAPKQILVNAHVNLDDRLTAAEIVQTIAEIEEKLKRAEPKVDMIFLEAASVSDTAPPESNPKHTG